MILNIFQVHELSNRQVRLRASTTLVTVVASLALASPTVGKPQGNFIATIPVGASPQGIAISGTYAYVSNQGDNNLSVIDTDMNAVTGIIARSNPGDFRGPFGVAVDGQAKGNESFLLRYQRGLRASQPPAGAIKEPIRTAIRLRPILPAQSSMCSRREKGLGSRGPESLPPGHQ